MKTTATGILEKSFLSPCTPLTSVFRVGGLTVKVVGNQGANVSLDSSLDPFRVNACEPDISIQVDWVDELPPTSARKLFDSGSVWRVYEDGAHLQFDFSAATLGVAPYKRLFVDEFFRQATVQVNRECFPEECATSPLEYPLDELLVMHRLTQERAIELHGVGIVGPDGATNLFVGHSGAGKSTTARLWTSLHNVEILSDDRIIVREHHLREYQVLEHSEHEDSTREDETQIFMYGTPWHGEAHFALPQRAPLQRIFVLEHGFGNVLTRLSRSQTVGELFARAFVPFHRHEYVDHALNFLERVADSVPCYRYSFEPDDRAVEKILHFHD